MSFQEKSAWACFVSMLAVFVPYFAVVFQNPMASVGLLVVVTVGLILLQILFHSVNALVSRSIRQTSATPPLDELDRKIELRAAKWAGFVLAFLVMSWVLIAMYGLPMVGDASTEIPITHVMLAVQWLLLGFVVANLAYYGIIIGGYRALAHG